MEEGKKMKKLVSGFLLIATLITLGACHKGQASKNDNKLEKVTFVLDWTPNTNHTGLYVAKEKGYFKQAGLDVSIVQPSDGDASTIVASNKAQFGISAQDSLAANYVSDKPLPITTVAAILQHNTSGIISRKGSGIDHPKGLEKKIYATWDSPIEQAMIKDVMAKDNGGDFNKVKLIPNTIVDEPLALKQKQADAIWIFYGWGGIKAGVDNVAFDYFNFKDINPVFDYYTPVIFANDTFLKEKPKTAQKFLAAARKGYEDAIQDPKAAATILCQEVPELDKNLVEKSQVWISKQYQAEAKQWGYIDSTRWNAFYDWLSENKLVAKKIPKNTGFTNDYLSE